MQANYAAAKESMLRLKGTGINMVYTHNYGCEPGADVSFAEILRAADDVGMLLSLSQPHFGRYNWKSPDAERTNGYAQLAEFDVRAVQNHPAVVFYSTSHNTAGYHGDMDPDMIDGISDLCASAAQERIKGALRAEAIINRLDPTRIVYHHAGGNIGTMHSINFYPNMVPIQEMDDWFEHWATAGVKPAFTCEYGAPFTWDWTMYRGRYKGRQEWGSAGGALGDRNAEWNSQFVGDTAYRILDAKRRTSAGKRGSSRLARCGTAGVILTRSARICSSTNTRSTPST